MGMYVEAVIDSETGQLVRNENFQVLDQNGSDVAIVYEKNLNTGEVVELSQPFQSDSSGNVRFWANPGYYYLSRGGTPTLIEVFGEDVFVDDGGDPDIYLTNHSTSYDPTEYAVVFNRSYRPSQVLGADYTIEGPFPAPCDYFYSGTPDITVTFDTDYCYANDDWTFTQLGTGKITIAIASGKGTRSNYYGHTKTAGPKAMIVVKQVKGPVLADDGLEFVIAGITA